MESRAKGDVPGDEVRMQAATAPVAVQAELEVPAKAVVGVVPKVYVRVLFLTDQVDAAKDKMSILAHAHPLDPLRPEEITAAVQTVRLAFGKDHPASSSICFIECTVNKRR